MARVIESVAQCSILDLKGYVTRCNWRLLSGKQE